MSGRCEGEGWVKGEKCGLLDSPGIILTCNSHRMSWAHLKSTQVSVEGQIELLA